MTPGAVRKFAEHRMGRPPLRLIIASYQYGGVKPGPFEKNARLLEDAGVCWKIVDRLSSLLWFRVFSNDFLI